MDKDFENGENGEGGEMQVLCGSIENNKAGGGSYGL